MLRPDPGPPTTARCPALLVRQVGQREGNGPLARPLGRPQVLTRQAVGELGQPGGRRGTAADQGGRRPDRGQRHPAVAVRQVGDLDLAQVLAAAADQGPAGTIGVQGRRVRGLDHVLGVTAFAKPQRHPQGGVGPDLPGDHPGRSLGGQHQVDAEPPADRGHPDQGGQQVRVLLGQHPELVHHDHQPWWGKGALDLVEDGLVEGGRAGRLGGQALAAAQFGEQ